MTPEERSMRARLAAHTLWSKVTDRSAATAKARRGLLDRFEREVDPEGVLDPATRAKLAESAKKAFYTKMALRSAQVRRKRAA